MTDPELARLILTVLKRGGHVGRHNAIHRDALLTLLSHYGVNISDRKFRDVYNSDACPVCVIAEFGMWIPDRWHEVEMYLRSYGAHVRPELLKARAAVMTLAYHELMIRDVGPLFNAEPQTEGARA